MRLTISGFFICFLLVVLHALLHSIILLSIFKTKLIGHRRGKKKSTTYGWFQRHQIEKKKKKKTWRSWTINKTCKRKITAKLSGIQDVYGLNINADTGTNRKKTFYSESKPSFSKVYYLITILRNFLKYRSYYSFDGEAFWLEKGFVRKTSFWIGLHPVLSTEDASIFSFKTLKLNSAVPRSKLYN
jgi:hypothetical protein